MILSEVWLYLIKNPPILEVSCTSIMREKEMAETKPTEVLTRPVGDFF